METIQLSVETRQEKGKERAGRMRRAGNVPCVFYGAGRTALSISINAREFQHKLAHTEGTHLVRFQSLHTDLNERLALLKEIQFHPVTNAPLHIDFYAVDEKMPIQASVPLHFTGKAEGVTAGGTLQALRREILVEGLPLNIPEFLNIDVTHLGIHHAIHMSDLSLPDGVNAVGEPHLTLVTVLAPVVSAKPAEEAPPEEETPAPTEETASS